MNTAVLLHAVRACPDAGPYVGCACARVRRCRRYDRDVAISECLKCVRDGGLDGDGRTDGDRSQA